MLVSLGLFNETNIDASDYDEYNELDLRHGYRILRNAVYRHKVKGRYMIVVDVQIPIEQYSVSTLEPSRGLPIIFSSAEMPGKRSLIVGTTYRSPSEDKKWVSDFIYGMRQNLLSLVRSHNDFIIALDANTLDSYFNSNFSGRSNMCGRQLADMLGQEFPEHVFLVIRGMITRAVSNNTLDLVLTNRADLVQINGIVDACGDCMPVAVSDYCLIGISLVSRPMLKKVAAHKVRQYPTDEAS